MQLNNSFLSLTFRYDNSKGKFLSFVTTYVILLAMSYHCVSLISLYQSSTSCMTPSVTPSWLCDGRAPGDRVHDGRAMVRRAGATNRTSDGSAEEMRGKKCDFMTLSKMAWNNGGLYPMFVGMYKGLADCSMADLWVCKPHVRGLAGQPPPSPNVCIYGQRLAFIWTHNNRTHSSSHKARRGAQF